MNYLANLLGHTPFAACALLILSSAFVNADVTYEGSEGVKNQIFESAIGRCTNCHVAGNGLPLLDNYDDASDEIIDILDRINRAPMGDFQLMPQGGPKLSQPLLDLMAGWNADGVPEWSPPQLTVTGHSMLTSDSADLEGTMQENGRDTNAFFKYWQAAITEPTNCPPNNSIFSGCTASVSPDGSGGGDIEEPDPFNITSIASGLNCATTYNFRAVSQFNGQFFTQSSPGTLGFTTIVSAFDADADLICDAVDNCPAVANPGQLNNDGDAEGDACDLDDDNDGVEDMLDNCPFNANPGQEDSDDNGIGDACEADESLCFPVQSENGKAAIICL